jgi:hypothetical protein
VRLGREGQRLDDGKPGIERGVGVLEHHLHLAAQLVDGDAVRLVDRIAVEHHGAAVGLQQPDQEPRHRRLAAARFAHHAQGLAFGDRQAEIVDRTYHLGGAAEQAAHHREVLAQAGRGQQRLSRAAAIGRGHQRVHQAFTSMAARRPSLIRLKQIEVMKIITPGSAAKTGFT